MDHYQVLTKEKKFKSWGITSCLRIEKRFHTDQWLTIKIFSDHQRKYRYYKKAIEVVKRRTSPHMNEQAIMTFSAQTGV